MPAALPLAERLVRAQLMRETGLKCIGFIGIPKVSVSSWRQSVGAAAAGGSCAPSGDGRQSFSMAPGPRSCSSRRRTLASLQLQQRASSCSSLADTNAQVINNLAALRAAVDEDAELAEALPTAPRRCVALLHVPLCHSAHAPTAK